MLVNTNIQYHEKRKSMSHWDSLTFGQHNLSMKNFINIYKIQIKKVVRTLNVNHI